MGARRRNKRIEHHNDDQERRSLPERAQASGRPADKTDKAQGKQQGHGKHHHREASQSDQERREGQECSQGWVQLAKERLLRMAFVDVEETTGHKRTPWMARITQQSSERGLLLRRPL